MTNNKQLFPLVTTVVATVILLTLIGLGWRLYHGDGRLLSNVAFGAEQITPNADGSQDATPISYEISRKAHVSIYFENPAGERFYFRQERLRGAGEYTVLFSGVVDGYTRPDELIQGEIIARLLADGEYQWVISATDEQGVTEQETGVLTIAEADTSLPELRDFGLDKAIFTPNRDGINDRVLAQYYLTKEANVRVFLQTETGAELPIGEIERDIPAGQPGRHYYDYEGGVDNGETPPDDGEYTIVAVAEDAEGQKMRVEDKLTIALGGVPRADIFAPPAGDTFQVSATSVAICDTLFFTVTVENYGTTPIRTTGPESGTVYDAEWNYNTLGWFTESGAWRVAVGYENELNNYQYRWAVGRPEDLTEIDGFLYLLPGERAIVTGGIRLTGPLGDRNPQPMWAGLIHEDVEISQFNNRVDPKAILLDMPDPAHREPCPARELPMKGSSE